MYSHKKKTFEIHFKTKFVVSLRKQLGKYWCDFEKPKFKVNNFELDIRQMTIFKTELELKSTMFNIISHLRLTTSMLAMLEPFSCQNIYLRVTK